MDDVTFGNENKNLLIALDLRLVVDATFWYKNNGVAMAMLANNRVMSIKWFPNIIGMWCTKI